MANITVSSNMNLPIPVTGVDPGPDYANNVNNSLNLVDAHDHSPGKGVQITPAGININVDLTMNGNNLTNSRALRLQTQGSTPSNPSDLQEMYSKGGDLYYIDGFGNNVRITQSGGIAGSPGSISGLVPPASATYVAGTSTFVFQSGTNLAANLDASSIILRNLTVGSPGLTLAPPTLGSSYTITFPTLPVYTPSYSVPLPMSMDSSGNITTGPILISQMGALTSGGPAAPLGSIAVSGSTGTFTSSAAGPTPVVTVQAVFTGNRPIRILLTPEESTNGFYLISDKMDYLYDSTTIIGTFNSPGGSSSLEQILFPTAGLHTVTLRCYGGTQVFYAVLIMYEI